MYFVTPHVSLFIHRWQQQAGVRPRPHSTDHTEALRFWKQNHHLPSASLFRASPPCKPAKLQNPSVNQKIKTRKKQPSAPHNDHNDIFNQRERPQTPVPKAIKGNFHTNFVPPAPILHKFDSVGVPLQRTNQTNPLSPSTKIHATHTTPLFLESQTRLLSSSSLSQHTTRLNPVSKQNLSSELETRRLSLLPTVNSNSTSSRRVSKASTL